MKNLDENALASVRVNLEDNLDEFKKKFILFFIGLCCFGVGIVVGATGSPIASLFIFGTMACWGGPLAVKFWFSGFGSIFDFQYKTYEIDQYGNRRDVSTIDSVLTGPFLKCVVAILVVLFGTFIAPVEMIVRLLNHVRFEKELGIKGSIAKSPRREAVLCAIVLVVMFVVATVVNAITTIGENTSDMGDSEAIEIIESLENQKNYTITMFDYSTESNKTYATVTESGDTITFVVERGLEYGGYTLGYGTYTYTNGAWQNVDDKGAAVLNKYTLKFAFDFDAMKANPDQIVINEDKGLGGRVDREEHSYYEITPKKNSSLSFTTFYLDKEGGFGTWSDYNYVYIFEK